MDFGMLPPEINSGRMYAGPGAGPMLAAAEAWDGLAAELQSTAASYSLVISGLTVGWQGPSSMAMAAAAAPYAAWMRGTAAQAEQAGAQAKAAAIAYQTAFVAMAPPLVIAANRSQLASLVAGNLFGQNTSAIAATEAQYVGMWAQDAAAMYGYAGSAAAATQLTPFTEPPQTTNPAGAAGQTAAAHALGASAGTDTQSALTQLMSAVPRTLQRAAAPGAPALPSLPSLSSIKTIAQGFQNLFGIGVPAQAVGQVSVISGQSMHAQSLSAVLNAAGSAGASGPGLGALSAGLSSEGFGAAGSAVSAGMGEAGMVGALSVPPSWAAATPMVRLAAAALHNTNAAAAPAVTGASAESTFGQLALASLAGSALGGTVPHAIGATAIRGGRPISDKDSQTPDKLKRVLAELSEKPESVQHWHTDKAHLESLLAQLSKKPGIHAVHLSAGDKPKATSPKARWG